MSKYTTELRYALESGYDIGLKTYPIFEEAYRNVLNDKIKEHFYFREIGFETIALFKRFLNRKMNEIMPLYNQFYLSQKLITEPLSNNSFIEKSKKDTMQNKNDTINRNLISDENITNNTDTTQNNTSLLTQDEASNTKSTLTLDTSLTENGTNTINENLNSTVTNNKENTHNDNTTEETIAKKIKSDTPQAILSVDNINDNLYASNAQFDTLNNSINNTGDTTETNNTKSEAINTNTGENSKTTLNTGTNITDTDTTTALQTNGNIDTTGNTKSTGNDNITTNENIADNSEMQGFENFIREYTGFTNITQSDMILKYRETFLNIDMQIIEELEPLFMQLW